MLAIFAGRRIAARRGGETRELEASALALGYLLFFGSAVAFLLVSDMYEFSWRYQLPALVTLHAQLSHHLRTRQAALAVGPFSDPS